MRSRIAILVIISGFLAGLVPHADAQTSRELKRRRESLLQDIRLTEKALTHVRAQEAQTLDELQVLEEQIRSREQVIATMNTEMKVLDREADSLGQRIEGANLAREEALRTWQRLARYRLYYRLSEVTPWQFLLAAPQWNLIFERMVLVDRLAERSREAARRYRDEARRVSDLRTEQSRRREDLSVLLVEATGQQTQTRLEQQEQGNLLDKLKRDNRSLATQQERQQQEVETLAAAISELVRKEILAQQQKSSAPKKGASAKVPPAKTSARDVDEALDEAPDSRRLTGEFASNRGRLGWPVDRGLIIRQYGTQQHPNLPQVRINSTGVDFRTEEEAPVKAVFEGTVAGIQWVPGYAHTILVKHGQYFTVYSNLASTGVKKGEKVGAGTRLGSAAVNPVSGTSEIHFEIWKGRSRENPSLWFAKSK